ncbi:MAG: hypothetical protein PHE87_05895, partial [Victivallaceae bacterium]|nr:hypothetical protein [Victivallaceae bacterium]
MKSFLSFVVFALILPGVFAAEQVNFLSKPLTAGKTSLTENGFVVSKTIGTANFSPELRLPIQLIYNSSNEKTGLFGFGWSSPQLESSAYYDKGGVLWTTPWGEKIKFSPKDAKTPKDAITIELYEPKKGRGFYAPYSEWEANTSKREYTDCGDWVFTGKRKYEGWKFVYRDANLRSITAPSGRSVWFSYLRNRVTTISQNDQPFVEFSYADTGNQLEKLTINGIEHKFSYQNGKLVILPKTTSGKIVNASRPQLIAIKTGDLNPAEFSYDDYGFLKQVQQGDFVDTLTVQHQTLAERQAELNAKKDRKVKYSGPINGRLLSDVLFKYKYSDREPGTVKLINQQNQTATYDYNQKTGIFKIDEFSGKSYSIYYFMRYDVAYLGKVRKIEDGRGRDVISYRYDKLTGNVVRVRDMAENDINFSYY